MSMFVTKRGPNGAAASLLSTLRQAPATVPALAAIVLFIVWATDQAGYPLTHWAPGGLIVLALLGLTLALVGLRAGEVPVPVKLAVGCLAAYTALSFASILWAAVPGEAWEGANRTLLYLLVFALFALWRQRGASAALPLGGWTLAMIALAAFVALHVNADAGRLGGLFAGERLAYPTGYPNASAAQWLMAFWPALLLARSERLPWALRGVLAGGAVLLAEVALLSQSRGSLYATPVMLVLVFALLPGRVRTFAVLVPVAVGVGVAAPTVLHVGDRLKSGGGNAAAAMHAATTVMFAAALVVGLVVAVGAAIESRGVVSPATGKRLHKGVAAVAVLALLAVLAGGLVAAGNPVTRVRHGWDTFKGGYAADNKGGNRLVSGLGSNRYDFYRVGLNEFASHPLVGIGADNFEQQYLRYGRSDETPHYPHSVELRTLAQTGVIGALLALVGLAAALLAAARGLRGADPLGRAVVAAALAGFGYWVVHGSFDWFWEFAGLGAPAFAMLGLACALAPRRSQEPARAHQGDEPAVAAPPVSGKSPGGRRGVGLRGVGIGLGALAAMLAALSITAPWLSQRQVQSAARVWRKSPLTAYARLNDAARLNPLSDEAYVVAGSIALRFDDLARADHEFALALERTPGDAYATLERGAIASTENNRRDALELLVRAALLNPRDPLTRQALRLAKEGKRVDVEELNRSILLNAQQLA
jgi:tetratricopeptide (TPR) repeat protein